MSWYIYLFIFIIFTYWFFYDKQPYYTEIRFGKKGSGKTCDIAKLSMKAQKKGIKVYSNIEIPGNYVFNPKDVNKYTFEPYSLVLIDEVGLIWDNRDFKSFEKGVNEFFKYSRQSKLKIIMYSQAYNDIDLKIRLLFDRLCLMKRIGKITLIRPIVRDYGVATDINGNGQIVDTYKFASIFTWKFNYMPRYYGLFKSFNPPSREIINSTYERYNDLNEIYKDSKKYILFKIKVLFDKPKVYLKRFHQNLNQKVSSK